jgi:hypothetical protein
MGKKTFGRHDAKPAFRESDFAGKPAREQAELSGSLNQLSQQIVSTRQLLQEIEARTAPLAPIVAMRTPDIESPVPPPLDNGAREGEPSDGDTAVPL